MEMLKDDLITGAQAAAEYMGRTRAAIYHMVAQGTVPAIHKGQRLYFRKSELDAAFRSKAA